MASRCRACEFDCGGRLVFPDYSFIRWERYGWDAPGCKGCLLGRATIEAVQFEEDPAPDYVGVRPSELPYDETVRCTPTSDQAPHTVSNDQS